MSLSNIDKTTDLTSDIYGLNEYVNQVKKDFTPGVDEDTLLLGIFGYMGQIFSDTIQNSIVMASEFSNESIPVRAKFEKNIIAHALGLGITDINAIPATFDVLLTFSEDDIESWYDIQKFNKGEEFPWEFTLDKDIPIYIGDYEFHIDYDILIKKVKVSSGNSSNNYTYTAKYLIDIDNPVSDITNPYLTPPVKINSYNKDIIFTKCTLRQVEKNTIHKKVLSDNSISSKIVTFEFEDQLADFTIDVTEGNTTTHLIPVYEGLNVEVRKYPYFYYTYLNSNTIRIKFDRSSYVPRINSDVQINLQTTRGESGNFEYKPAVYPYFSAESDKYGYSNIICEIRPITGESLNGTNKKSIDELKKLIPKEALSRGSITNLTDLQNFFNMLDGENSILYFYKKRDNALERLYYSFILMKDAYDVIIPTNTIDIEVEKGQLDNSNKQVIVKNQCVKLVDGKGILYDINNIDNDYENNFYYVIPYNFVINIDPLYGMYFLTTINTNKYLDFTYINENCLYQYIATSIGLYRGYNINPNTYELTIDMEKNITNNDTSGKNIRCIALLYDEEDNPIRWAEAKLVNEENDANIYTFKFNFDTDDYIDKDNKIRITSGLYNVNMNKDNFIFGNSLDYKIKYFDTESKYSYPDNMPNDCLDDEYVMTNNKVYRYNSSENNWIITSVDDGIYYVNEIDDNYDIYVYKDKVWSKLDNSNDGDHILVDSTVYTFNDNKWQTSYIDSYFESNTKCVIHILNNIDKEEYGLNGLDSYIPIDSGYSLSNSYTVLDGIDFFYDYSDIINSIVTVSKDDETGTEKFTIKNVPVVKYNYFNEESKALEFCQELTRRKNYIDYAVKILEDAFGMDFKFFNTYGPSKLFTLDNVDTYLNRTNLSLTFRLKLRANYDTNITNEIIADIKKYIEDINEINTVHMSNLVAEIIAKYIQSIEFFEFVDMNGYGPSIQHIYSMDMPDEVIVPEFVNVMALPDGTPDINLILV